MRDDASASQACDPCWQAAARVIAVLIGVLLALGSFAPIAEAETLRTVPLRSLDAGADSGDLEAFWPPLMDGIEVVGLGEANHGTSEFFRFKHRMIEYLVLNYGFRTVAIESGFAACERLNAYVLGEPVDLLDALYGQQYTIWVTQEMVETIRWIRQFNAGRARDDQVEFVGFDTRDNGVAQKRISTFLERYQPALFAEIASVLDAVTLTGFGSRDDALVHAGELDRVLASMVRSEADLRFRAGDTTYENALQALRVLRQAVSYASAETVRQASDSRDRGMAENIAWRMRRSPDRKIIIWAHNGHVGVGANGVPDGRSLGFWLRERLGERYLALGFTFGHGTFRAYGEQDGTTSYHPFPVGAPQAGFAGDVLGRLGEGPILIDVRTARSTGALPTTLREPVPVRWADGGVNPGYEAQWRETPLRLDLAREFDVIAHIPTISACAEVANRESTRAESTNP